MLRCVSPGRSDEKEAVLRVAMQIRICVDVCVMCSWAGVAGLDVYLVFVEQFPTVDFARGD